MALNLGFSSSSTSSKSSGSESGLQETVRLDDGGISFLDELYKLFGQRATKEGEFTREKAIEDTEGTVNQLFQQFAETMVPDILSSQAQTGGYSGTTAQQLSNDAFARTLREGAALRLQTIGNYAQINQQQQALDVESMAQALQARLQAREQTSLESKFKSRTSSRGSSFGIGGKFG